jgi:nucleotidyltransferase substrate binding protein (TIGR01987 family)
MENKDIRWKQRFQNFEKSLAFLEKSISIYKPDIVQKAGLIQFFDISIELGWYVLKDYLENEGFSEIKTPRDAIKKAFEIGLIDDGETWLEAIKNRNQTSHIYDEEMADEIIINVNSRYLLILQSLKNILVSK